MLCIFCLFFFYSNLCAQAKEMNELRKMNEDWIASYPKKDSATLNKIFADDFVLINPVGMKFTRNDIINNLAKQQVTLAHVDSADVRMLTHDVAIITAYASFKFIVDGKEQSSRTCYQDIYMMRNGRWQAVSAHVTSLNTQ